MTEPKRKPGRPISTLPSEIFYRRAHPDFCRWFRMECERRRLSSRLLLEDMRAAYGTYDYDAEPSAENP